MWMMFRVVPIMWRAVRPSKVVDMPAVVNSFWMRKGFDGLTFFGHILTPSEETANLFKVSPAMKNHEMIHLRQAQSCGDSWLRFYLLYIWYWFKIACFGGFAIRRKLKHAAYLLNPFEMEAYRHMNNLNYLANNEANEWRQFAKMSIKERLKLYEQKTPSA